MKHRNEQRENSGNRQNRVIGKEKWKESIIEKKTISSRKENRREQKELRKNSFLNSRHSEQKQKKGMKKMSDDGYSICLHIQQDLYWRKYLKGR